MIHSTENKEISLYQFQKTYTTVHDNTILAGFARKFSSWLDSMKLPADLICNLRNLYIPLVNLLRKEYYLQTDHIPVIGISGSQGSGKSTFTTLLSNLLEEAYGYRVACFSIDDFYHTRIKREKLSRDIHPLLITRGVPGTHDVDLGMNTLTALQNAKDHSQTFIPVFDKSIDDRKFPKDWKIYKGRPDIILFEGWCVGAVPESSEKLIIPVNDLERRYDQSATFRTYVNNQLSGDYQKWFSLIDFLIMLKVPSFDLVYEWRLLQEKKLADAIRYDTNTKKSLKIMSEDEIIYFIRHYERITRHMLEEMSDRSNLVLTMAEDHNFRSVRYNSFI